MGKKKGHPLVIEKRGADLFLEDGTRLLVGRPIEHNCVKIVRLSFDPPQVVTCMDRCGQVKYKESLAGLPNGRYAFGPDEFEGQR